MKKVLITGADSYIGTSVENWLMKEPDKYQVNTIDMKDKSWKEHDFSKYDSIFHVAGIAHIKETKENQNLYYTVNRDLAIETAEKAKTDGVNHFVFLSTMSVYGLETGYITKDTQPNPKTAYGKSKLEAKNGLKSMGDENFKVAILRPPMVYGKGCKGNYKKLAKLAKVTPIFPKVDNKRSMIYIDNLSEFARLLIDNNHGGIFLPQNKEYVNTSEMVKLIAEANGKKVRMTKLFNPLIKRLNISTLNKVFGDLVYEMSMSEYECDYRVIGFRDTIRKNS